VLREVAVAQLVEPRVVVPVVGGSSPLRHPRTRFKFRLGRADTRQMTLPAAEALQRETTIAGVLKTTCVQLTTVLEAEACNLSRVIGQLLVDLVEYSRDGRRIQLGRAYLLPDYPVTQEVIDSGEPRTVWLFDPGVDPGEAALLREMDFDALLMLPLQLDGRCWGLLEVYRMGTRVFSPEDVALGVEIAAYAGEAIENLQRRAAAA
jgi:GAF domain-containing protein